jgi:hypothetical protein
VVGLALVGGLALTVLVTVVITYRPASIDGPRGRSNWRQAMPPAVIFYAGNVALTSTHHVGVELLGIVLMIVGIIGLLRNRNRTYDAPPPHRLRHRRTGRKRLLSAFGERV